MQSVRASTLIPRGFVVDDAVNDVDGTLITMRPIGGGELVSGVRSTFGNGFTVDILGVLRICPLRAVGYVSYFLHGVSAAVQFSADAAFSMNGLTQTYWRLGPGEPLGSTISCIISRSLWAVDRRRASHVV